MLTGFVSRRGFCAAAALAFPDLACGETPSPDAESVAAENDAAMRLSVDVQIDGKGPFKFVVDTGAERTVISDATADSIGLKRGRKVIVEGVVRSIPADTVHIGELSFGSADRSDLVVPVLPRKNLLADGYLGLDVVRYKRLILDFKNNQLLVVEPVPATMWYTNRPGEARVRASGWGGHLQAFDCRVDGLHTSAFIDTGAEVSVVNPALFDVLARRDPGYVRKDTIPITGVTGGEVQGRITTLRSVRLGNLDFESCEVAVAGLQIFKLWDFEAVPSLLIGMNWLRQFSSVSIDYGRKEFRFQMAHAGAIARSA